MSRPCLCPICTGSPWSDDPARRKSARRRTWWMPLTIIVLGLLAAGVQWIVIHAGGWLG